MENHSILYLVLLMAGITYFTRVLHVFIPINRIPAWFKHNMHLVPVVVIASIITSSVFVHNGQINLSKSLGYIAAMAITSLAYFLSKSSGAAVIIGLGTYMAIKAIGF